MADEVPRSGRPGQDPPGERERQPREPRTALAVPIRYRYESILDFIESQSVNVSRTGMFVAGGDALPVGTNVEFEVVLADGYVLLSGRAEVARTTSKPPGMGLRFREMDEASRTLIDKIVDVNEREGKRSTVPLDFTDVAERPSPRGPTPTPALGVMAGGSLLGASTSTPAAKGGVTLNGEMLKIQLNPATVSYFVYNPLLNIKLGGFVIPADQDVSLGTTLSVTITELDGKALFVGRGKVVAKHDRRLGVRLVDTDRATLARLQAQVTKLAPK